MSTTMYSPTTGFDVFRNLPIVGLVGALKTVTDHTVMVKITAISFIGLSFISDIAEALFNKRWEEKKRAVTAKSIVL